MTRHAIPTSFGRVLTAVAICAHAVAASSAPQAVGEYRGTLVCGMIKSPASLVISSAGGDRLTAALTVVEIGGGYSPQVLQLTGTFDRKSHSVDLKTSGGPRSPGFLRLRGTVAPSPAPLITGTIGDAVRCQYEFKPMAAGAAPLVPPPPLPPERRNEVSNIAGYSKAFEYIDATMTGAAGKGETIDTLFANEVKMLQAHGWRCVRSDRLRWRGQSAISEDNVSFNEFHLVRCRGDCARLQYHFRPPGTPRVFHYGLTRPIPTMETWFGVVESHLRWVFTVPAGAKPPDVTVFKFTTVPLAYGECPLH
jgi:hypothetical protein